MDSVALKLLVIARQQTEEMRAAADSLQRLFPDADICWVRTFGAVERLVEAGWRADLVVVCQHWPHEFSDSQANRLLGRLPLARWVCLAGSWCEAMGRTGSAWPRSILVPARAAATRLRRERDVLAGLAAPLPWTASREETFAFDHAEAGHRPDADAEVRIVTPDTPLRRMLQDLLTEAGYSVRTELAGQEQPRAVVWDVDPWSREALEPLRAFSKEQRNVPIVALAALGHPEDETTLASRGVDRVVAKTAAPALLSRTLDDLLQPSRY